MHGQLRKMAGALAAAALACALAPGIALAADGLAAEGGAAPEAALEAASGAVFDARAELDAQAGLDELDVQALPSPDYGWYDASASAYTLSTANQLLGFANMVNGADGQAATTFEGKTVRLATSGIYPLGAGEWMPIGDAGHQFLGAFDGNGATVDNFRVTGEGRSAYLGLFGYVGAGGSVRNLKVGASAQVSASRDSSSSDVLHHIAGVAGYCAGTMTGCQNLASVTVESGVQQTDGNHQVIYAVGGVAGECVFDMESCSNSGAISVRATADPVSEVDDSALVHYVGGVAGILGDSTRVGRSGAVVATDPSKHGSMSLCVNVAQVSVDTPSEAGKDRFGATAFARSIAVGGVVGFSQGSVSNCTNGTVLAAGTASSVGYVRAEHATSAGGVVGSLRGLFGSDNPATRSNEDDGVAGEGNDPISIVNCANYGDVYALNAAGGIAGHAGTYTAIKGCVNSNKKTAVGGDVRTWVVATRWNKPAPAGIVGSTSGDVAYCANLGTVVSGTWTDEAARQYSTASGYYVAGIAGMLSYYQVVDENTQATVRVSPIPEVYGCYNAGDIVAVAGMRQRGIVGENDGYVHDCVLLSGTVGNDELAYGGKSGDSEASGTVDNCKVLSSAELKSDDAIACLNAPCSTPEWQAGFYWVRTTGTDVSAHYGYPVLSTNGAAPTPASIAGAAASCSRNARYNGGSNGDEAVPSMTVKLGSATLTERVDYYVVPQSGAVEVTDPAQPYKATIVGIGAYKDSIAQVAYGISKGYLSECVMTVEGKTFNYEAQYPTVAMVTVKTKSGVVIDPQEYEIAGLVDSKGNATTAPVDKGNYTLTVKVKQGSSRFETGSNDTLEGTYRISPANIMRVIDYSKVTISWNGETYPWVSSSDEADPDHPKTTLAYTGGPIKPTVSGLLYNGHDLVEGTDYRIVYGNPNPENGDTSSHDANNTGVAGGTTVGCVTVRYVTNSNFTNYVNMFFSIADDGTGYSAMYRLYNPYSGEHHYTSVAGERDDLVVAGWTDEGVGWTAPSDSETPVYRLYNSYEPLGDHHYTTSKEEYDQLVEVGWTGEDIGWYSDDAEGVPLYREYNPNAYAMGMSGAHHYTANQAEADGLTESGWIAEGISWYGLLLPDQEQSDLTAAQV